MFGSFRSTETMPAMPVPVRGAERHRAVEVTEVPGYVRESLYLACKRLVDVTFGMFFLAALSPVIASAAILVVMTSSGPAFYTQVRLGYLGRPFVIWKLRTMRHGAESRSGARWSLKGDSRVTRVGRILRRLHIDEFPQLWNVLRGDMSLVGPRPERPEFFPALEAAVPNYAHRLLVKPGVTGMAQAYLPADEDLPGVRRKQLFDLHYIRNLSFSLDVRLMLATAIQAGGCPHCVTRRILLLPRGKNVELGG